MKLRNVIACRAMSVLVCLYAFLLLGCDSLGAAPSSEVAPAEEIVGTLKSFGLQIASNAGSFQNTDEPWRVQLSGDVKVHRHPSRQLAKDYCWVIMHKIEPNECITKAGWSIIWSEETPKSIVEMIKQQF